MNGLEELYQQLIVDLYKNPLNFGRIENPDLYAQLNNSTCGDNIELFIKLKNGRIEFAKFMGKGCAISQASASLFTGYLKDKRLDQMKKITSKDVLDLLKIDLTKNPSRMKCALLVFETMKKILRSK